MKRRGFYFLLVLVIGAFLPAWLLAGSATLNWQPNGESDLAGYRVYYGTETRIYGPPLNVSTATEYSLNDLAEGMTYYFAVTALDTSGNESGYSIEVQKAIADGTPPVVSLSTPTSDGSYVTNSDTLMVTGTASDNVGVTQVVWENSSGGSGTASGTSSWSVSAIALVEGLNTLTFTARDAAGNLGSRSLAVTYNVPDTAAPTVTLSTPTSDGSYVTDSNTLMVTGTASDNVGVTQVVWENSLGGSGTASGTSSWSVSAIALAEGVNTLTFTARDAAGNLGSRSLAVTYNPPDTAAPTVTLSTPTSDGSYVTESDTLMVTGTASDNVGVTQVVWENSSGGSGTASGTSNWSVSAIALVEGVNTLTFTARDAAGNLGSRSLAVTYNPPDTAAPTVTLSTPTSDGSYVTESDTLMVAGTASDNVGVTQVVWENTSGGSGTASGTSSWSVSAIALAEGLNTLTFTARDAAGNLGSRSLAVTYNAPATAAADTVAPSVQIVSPTTKTNYFAQETTVDLAGTALDNDQVQRVTWQSSSGESGTAIGTEQWAVTGIPLSGWSTYITVTATDLAGNSNSTNLQVFCRSLKTQK
jgi:hypothetical protein